MGASDLLKDLGRCPLPYKLITDEQFSRPLKQILGGPVQRRFQFSSLATNGVFMGTNIFISTRVVSVGPPQSQAFGSQWSMECTPVSCLTFENHIVSGFRQCKLVSSRPYESSNITCYLAPGITKYHHHANGRPRQPQAAPPLGPWAPIDYLHM